MADPGNLYPSQDEGRIKRDGAAQDWRDHCAKVDKLMAERNPDEPEPGFKYMGWPWPEKWGNPVERYVSKKDNPTPLGRPWEQLFFPGGQSCKRLFVKVAGFPKVR